ncbi:hypothetical protein CAPTEDRAFT_193942 [Capitella teleta]|uniref:SUEL-type lectin domain-containing protein n=1 Tax=Capitella teleta TaxID=283909 RepID=R7TJI1_CAPTE|nr:hypothetical protein CAPTEDRAFT_193942 [Capitella teleta]|eukprot:ELT93839.1 hypothetical protein CAPTEDRAFT_193942 [Capitella teleta]
MEGTMTCRPKDINILISECVSTIVMQMDDDDSINTKRLNEEVAHSLGKKLIPKTDLLRVSKSDWEIFVSETNRVTFGYSRMLDILEEKKLTEKYSFDIDLYGDCSENIVYYFPGSYESDLGGYYDEFGHYQSYNDYNCVTMEYSAAGLWMLLVYSTYLPQCIHSIISIKEIIEETCTLENFIPRCSSAQEIFITQSHYGHMKMGKCVTVDTGHLGCMADVTSIAQERCNGKTRCQISADAEIARTQPCAQGIYTYLENAYVCVPDLFELDQCKNVAVGRHWKHTISTRIEHACIHQNRPLKITASESMDIEITAQIINKATVDSGDVYITVSDIQGNTTRMEIPRTSTSLQQTIDSSMIHVLFEQTEAVVLFSFRAVGCEDLVAPEFTWIERSRNTLTIGCVHNEYTWQVKCIGSKWIGFRGNCTRKTETKPDKETTDDIREKVIPNEIRVFTKVITTGFVCLRKAEYKAKASKGIELQEMTGDYSNTWKATLMRPVTNDLNNPNASPPQQFYVLNQQNDTPIGTLR